MDRRVRSTIVEQSSHGNGYIQLGNERPASRRRRQQQYWQQRRGHTAAFACVLVAYLCMSVAAKS